MKLPSALAIALLLAAVAPQAQAHHSFGVFDTAKTVTLQGTVYRFQWTNPHSWLWLSVAQTAGPPKIWGIETGSPTMLLRRGLERETFQPGDKVSVDIHPLRDGRSGGNFIRATFPDGHSVAVIVQKEK